eukprot:11665216-Alexandrium_andersonii.AAC.1
MASSRAQCTWTAPSATLKLPTLDAAPDAGGRSRRCRMGGSLRRIVAGRRVGSSPFRPRRLGPCCKPCGIPCPTT